MHGRFTPSPELEIAAEYIAAQFRRAGLEPAGDHDYFETALYSSVMPTRRDAALSLEDGARTLAADETAMEIQQAGGAEVSHAAAFKLAPGAAPAGEAAERVRGTVVFIDQPNLERVPRAERQRAADEVRRLRTVAESLRPALIVLIGPKPQRSREGPELREASAPPRVPVILVSDESIRDAIAAADAGAMKMTVSAHIPDPAATPLELHNVIGILHGSDPLLKDTFVILSAHYDHLGVRSAGQGDRIFNGANDNASGTASVIEIANALAGLPVRPKRSIVFIAFFGEERGELGSKFYVAHPVFPLSKTIANINLEQMGRTDEVHGPRIGQMNATGFDFTTIPPVFVQAGAETGIRVWKDEANSDPYFRDSDNYPFGEAGVPSTTLSVTYEFPDYHQPGDEWSKLDYENMARVDAAVALGTWTVADSGETAHWLAGNPKTEAFVRAREASAVSGQ
jgi:hypothetical protein